MGSRNTPLFWTTFSKGWSCKNLKSSYVAVWLQSQVVIGSQDGWILTPGPYHGQQGPAWSGSCPSSLSTPRPSGTPGHLGLLSVLPTLQLLSSSWSLLFLLTGKLALSSSCAGSFSLFRLPCKCNFLRGPPPRSFSQNQHLLLQKFTFCVACQSNILLLFLSLSLSLFFFFWSSYGIWTSQARYQIQATVVTYTAVATKLESFDPLCRAGDQTRVLVLQRCCWSHYASVGTPTADFLSPLIGM